MAIEFLNHAHDNEEVYMKATRTMEMLSRWIKALSKAIGKQRQQHGMKVKNQLENDEPTKAASVFLDFLSQKFQNRKYKHKHSNMEIIPHNKRKEYLKPQNASEVHERHINLLCSS